MKNVPLPVTTVRDTSSKLNDLSMANFRIFFAVRKTSGHRTRHGFVTMEYRIMKTEVQLEVLGQPFANLDTIGQYPLGDQVTTRTGLPGASSWP